MEQKEGKPPYTIFSALHFYQTLKSTGTSAEVFDQGITLHPLSKLVFYQIWKVHVPWMS